MPEFLKLQPPFIALEAFLAAIPASRLGFEKVNTIDALGRVLAKDLFSPHPLPEFPRSTVDGYAVRSGGYTRGFGKPAGYPVHGW